MFATFKLSIGLMSGIRPKYKKLQGHRKLDEPNDLMRSIRTHGAETVSHEVTLLGRPQRRAATALYPGPKNILFAGEFIMKRVLWLVVFLAAPSQGYCWNNTGHMITARLAWLNLEEGQRAAVIRILKKHPHYDEFLSTDKPAGFSEEEWVFLRAATWPDWVRSHHKAEYHHATWHFINYPFVAPGSAIDPNTHQPPADEENIVRQLGFAVKKVKSGNQEDQAVYLCWILHLVGDIHQPLHTTAYFSNAFPDGDRGGNLAYVILHDGANKTQLHPMWDGLLGKSTSVSAIGNVVKQTQELAEADQEAVKTNVNENKTFESWAKESFEVAKQTAYLNGKLPLGDEDAEAADIEVVPENYTKNAGHVARVQIAKAGTRLATTLADALK